MDVATRMPEPRERTRVNKVKQSNNNNKNNKINNKLNQTQKQQQHKPNNAEGNNMSSFLSIMREQEDENLSRKFAMIHQEEYLYDQEIELAKQLSLQDTQPLQQTLPDPQPPPQPLQLPPQPLQQQQLPPQPSQIEQILLESDLAFACTQQEKVDQQLAYYLQKQQLGIEGVYDDDDDDDDNNYDDDDDDDDEYKDNQNCEEADQTQQQRKPPVIDAAQRKEDMEISHVEERMQEKRVNSIPVALHHKDFDKSGKGVDIFPSQKSLKVHKSKYGDDKFPMQDSEHEYGLVTRVLGDTRYVVFCYKDCTSKICRKSGKMRFRNVWLDKGQVVLLKSRNFDDSKGTIVFKYDQHKYNHLLSIGELKVCDPKKLLTPDVFAKLLGYMDKQTKTNFLCVYEKDGVNNN